MMIIHSQFRIFRAAILFLLIVLPGHALMAQDETHRPTVEPELNLIYPLGGSPGSTVQVTVEGRALDGAHAVWFAQEGLTANIKTMEEIDQNDLVNDENRVVDSPRDQRVRIELDIPSTAQIAVHSLRLVTRNGITNPLPFFINSGPVFDEAMERTPNHTPDQAYEVQFPLTINGKLSKAGELDYYSFDVSKEEKLFFEIVTVASDFRPTLTLYHSDGSWLNPNKPSRLEFGEPPRPKNRWTYQFNRLGSYYVRVGSRYGKSSKDFIYQLKIGFADQTAPSETRLDQRRKDDWQERNFTRQLRLDRMTQLRSRTVIQPAAESTTDVTRIDEREPNGQNAEANVLELPVLINGTIEQPGDIDYYRFQVTAGEQLVFEVQTPQVSPPRFNPLLEILATDGREFLTNRHKKIALTSQDALSYLAILKLHLADQEDCGLHSISYLKTLEPKMVVSFDAPAEYYLRVGSLSSQNGHSSHAYRIMIRPQVPHMGEIEVNQDRINLVPGGAKKLTVVTEQEESFAGDIALLVDGLPPGVNAYTATAVEPRRPLGHPSEREECFIPGTQTATIVLFADQDAPLMPTPKLIQLRARPVVEGTPGAVFSIREIPLMIVDPTQSKLNTKVSSANRPNVPN